MTKSPFTEQLDSIKESLIEQITQLVNNRRVVVLNIGWGGILSIHYCKDGLIRVIVDGKCHFLVQFLDVINLKNIFETLLNEDTEEHTEWVKEFHSHHEEKYIRHITENLGVQI